jgi:hypothetical protein
LVPVAYSVLPIMQDFRPPAVPLVTHTPYFSIWSMAEKLTDDWPRHWTGAIDGMCGLIRIDGKVYRFMGPQPSEAPAMEQASLRVMPTRTQYKFRAAGVELTVEFLSPILADDIELASRPVTYLTLTAESTDGRKHDMEAYFDITAEACVDKPGQKVVGSTNGAIGSMGTEAQPILGASGDNIRIDWGQLLLYAPSGVAVCPADEARMAFVRGEHSFRGITFPRAASDRWPCLAAVLRLEKTAHLMIGYDEIYSAEYMGRKLRPWWRKKLRNAKELFASAEKERESIARRAQEFDMRMMNELKMRGGEAYATLGALAYRQAMAAHCIVEGPGGKSFMFSKENFSNGCIGTVDVTYPGSPLFLAYAPDLLEAQLEPVMLYAESSRWKFPFAPHDLGTYPLANGQVYGGGERTEEDQMPVEECGNMLILVDALCKRQKSPEFAKRHWKKLTQWANYLKNKGLDPENQLCTDDFAGHLAHNANLSLKAIIALGAYAQLFEMVGKSAQASEWRNVAMDMASRWAQLAEEDGQYKLAFDKPGTWSLKYNLIWDDVLEMHLFPANIKRNELSNYIKRRNKYGLPLDSRADYTKIDWVFWTASMGDREQFGKLIAPVLDWANTTRDRVPLTDWYDTKTGKCVGFRARSVVGGLFMPLLETRYN